MPPRKGHLEELRTLKVAPILGSSALSGLQKSTELRVLRSLIPFASKEQLSSYAVKAWLTFIMPKLQKDGYNFHDAFQRAAALWNLSAHAMQNGFRIPYDWSEVKYPGKGKAPLINQFHIRKILDIPDTKQETVAGSLGLDIREIWPKIVLGRNQFHKR